MTGNALKRSFVGQAALAIKRACTMMESHSEIDAISCKKYQNSKGLIHLRVSTQRKRFCEKKCSAQLCSPDTEIQSYSDIRCSQPNRRNYTQFPYDLVKHRHGKAEENKVCTYHVLVLLRSC